MEFHEAASGARLHANYFRPGGVSKDLPAGLTDQIAAWAETFPKFIDDLEDAADRQPHLEAAHRRYRRVQRRSRRWPGASPGRCCAPRGVPWDLRRVAALRHVRPRSSSRFRSAATAIATTAIWCGMAEMRESVKIIKQCLAKMKPGPGEGAGPQIHAADARRDEALDGGADPSLQAVHRGLSRAGRRDLHGGGKRRRASSACIWWPTAPTSRIAARSARPASRICRRST